MINHISIAARDPVFTAKTLAQFWEVEVCPFPMYDDSFIVFLGKNTSSCIEIYPAGVLQLEPTSSLPVLDKENSKLGGAFHAAITTPLNTGEIVDICEKAGWRCREESRGGIFSVVEVWIENHTLFELLTPEMANAYNGFINSDNWKSIFGVCD